MELTATAASSTARITRLLDTIRRRTDALAAQTVHAGHTHEVLLASIHATLRLDGSTVELDDVTAIADRAADARAGTTVAAGDLGDPDVAGGARPAATEVHPPAASWWTTLRAGEVDDEHLRAAEVLGALDALTATETDGDPHDDPLDVLRDLHVRLTRGLVDPTRAGCARQLPQAVHDASVGRILYFTLDPEHVPTGLEDVARLLRDTDTPAVVTAGLVHLQLLRVHPFDAANGRLARLVARRVLGHAGLDPHGLTAFEPVLATDPLGYHERVAAALRAHDPGPWLEYWGETLVQALRDAGRALGTLTGDVDPRTVRALATLPRDLTIVELRDALGTDLDQARARADELADAGLLTPVRGSSGLRFVRTID